MGTDPQEKPPCVPIETHGFGIQPGPSVTTSLPTSACESDPRNSHLVSFSTNPVETSASVEVPAVASTRDLE